MNEAGTAVLLSGLHGCGIKDVKTPLSDLISESRDELGHDRLCNGFDRGSLKGGGVGEDLSGKKDGIRG